MPTINHEPIPIPIFTDFDGVICRKWPAMANGDVGEPIALTRYSDRTVQVTGTPGAGGTLVIRGSNDGLTYDDMRDVFGNTISATGSKLITLTEVPIWIRPEVTGGDGTTSFNVAVAAVGRR